MTASGAWRRHGMRAHGASRDYVNRLADALGHADRREPLRAYLTGLCLPGERKSIEPMAARIDPRHVRARHQSMHHFVANAPWEEAAVLRVARDYVLARDGAAWARGARGSWTTPGSPRRAALGGGGPSVLRGAGQAGQLSGGGDRLAGERRDERAGRLSAVPAGGLGDGSAATPSGRGPARDGTFRPKWQIALEQIARCTRTECRPAPVVADAGYGVVHGVPRRPDGARRSLYRRRERETSGVAAGPAAIAAAAAARPGSPAHAACGPSASHRRSACGRPGRELPPAPWSTVTWREGTRGRCARASRAARAARPSRRARTDAPSGGWLLIEWPPAKPRRRSTGSRRCRPTSLGRTRPARPSCAGASSGTTKNSRTSSASIIRRARLAGLPSPRRLMHRGVCLPRGRAREAFPP